MSEHEHAAPLSPAELAELRARPAGAHCSVDVWRLLATLDARDAELDAARGADDPVTHASAAGHWHRRTRELEAALAELAERKDRERKVLVAWQAGELSIGQATALLGRDHGALRADLQLDLRDAEAMWREHRAGPPPSGALPRADGSPLGGDDCPSCGGPGKPYSRKTRRCYACGYIAPRQTPSDRLVLDTSNADVVGRPDAHDSPSPIATTVREKLERGVREAWARCNGPGATEADVRAYRAAHDDLVRELARESARERPSETGGPSGFLLALKPASLLTVLRRLRGLDARAADRDLADRIERNARPVHVFVGETVDITMHNAVAEVPVHEEG